MKYIFIIFISFQSLYSIEEDIVNKFYFINECLYSLNSLDKVILLSNYSPKNGEYRIKFKNELKKFDFDDSYKIGLHNCSFGQQTISVYLKDLENYQGFKIIKYEGNASDDFKVEIPLQIFEVSISNNKLAYNFKFEFIYKYGRWVVKDISNINYMDFECKKKGTNYKSKNRKYIELNEANNFFEIINIIEGTLSQKKDLSKTLSHYIKNDKLITELQNIQERPKLKALRYIYKSNCMKDSNKVFLVLVQSQYQTH